MFRTKRSERARQDVRALYAGRAYNMVRWMMIMTLAGHVAEAAEDLPVLLRLMSHDIDDPEALDKLNKIVDGWDPPTLDVHVVDDDD